MIVLLVAVVVALVVLRAGLRRAPLLTLFCVGLLGFALHTGTLTLPASVTTPAAHLAADVRAWQQRQASTLSCAAAEATALRSVDEASLERAGQLCDPDGRPSAR